MLSSSLPHLSKIAQEYPSLCTQLHVSHILLFIQLILALKERIAIAQVARYQGPPDILPIHIHNFLAAALSLDDDSMKLCWICFKGLAWNFAEELNVPQLLPLFLEHGLMYSIGKYLCLYLLHFLTTKLS